MAQYPIAANVEQLRASIDALRQKMSDNLTSRGIAGVAASMTVMELADKVLEVKYKPLPSVSRSRARALRSTSDIDASLLELQEVIYAARVRLKLNLEVRGVTGLTHSDTLSQLADKILEIKTTPQYELYPLTVGVGANGSFGEFYFNTKDAVKVDFAVGAGFTLDRTTGQGAGNFIIRVTGTNNTTADVKTATVTVTLDNGKYPSETIGVTQAAGVQIRELVDPYLINYQNKTPANSIRARGGEIFSEYLYSVVFMHATYNDKWNGITVSTKVVAIDSFPTLPEPFIVLTDGVTTWIDHLTARNNTTPSTRSATIVGHNNETGLSVPMVVSQAAGSVGYAYTGVLYDSLEFLANGTTKPYAILNFTGFGATIRTYWNGIETSSEYVSTADPRCTIEVIDNGGGFYVQAAGPYHQALHALNRVTVIGDARSCNVRCVYSEAGKGTFYSEYVTVTQEANKVERTDSGGYICKGYTKYELYTDSYTSGAIGSREGYVESNSTYCGYNPIKYCTIMIDGARDGYIRVTYSGEFPPTAVSINVTIRRPDQYEEHYYVDLTKSSEDQIVISGIDSGSTIISASVAPTVWENYRLSVDY